MTLGFNSLSMDITVPPCVREGVLGEVGGHLLDIGIVGGVREGPCGILYTYGAPVSNVYMEQVWTAA